MQPEGPNTYYYELHYVLNGVKKALAVEKSDMTELHAWLCVLMIIRHGTNGSPTDARKPLSRAIEAALELGIMSVRWNKTVLGVGKRPAIRFSLDADVLTMTTGDISLEKYRNNMP